MVAIDGLTTLRESLEHVERGSSLAELDRVLTHGPAVGIATIAVIDAARSGGTVLARFTQRWVFHLADRSDAPPLGVAAARVPPAIPGRLVVASSGLEAQVARLGRIRSRVVVDRSRSMRCHGSYRPRARPRPTHVFGPVVQLPVGLDFITLSTSVLRVPHGEHVLVIGPSWSGRSSALIRLIEAWRELHPGGLGEGDLPDPQLTARRAVRRRRGSGHRFRTGRAGRGRRLRALR